MRVRFCVVAAMLCFVAMTAFSSTLVNQPSVWSGNGTDVGLGVWLSHEDANGVGARTFDNFTLGTTSEVTGFTWRGMYYDSANLDNNPSGANTSNWQISIYSDDGSGHPGSVLYNDVTAIVTTSKIGSGLFVDTTVNVWEMSYTFNSPFLANAGTKYWVSPFSRATNLEPTFDWLTGTNGDNHDFQASIDGSTSVDHLNDQAFSLLGTPVAPVPEPATIVLLGSGLVAGLRRKLK